MSLVQKVHAALYRRDPSVAEGFIVAPEIKTLAHVADEATQRTIITKLMVDRFSHHPVASLDAVALLHCAEPGVWLEQVEGKVADVVCNLLLF